MLLYTALNGYYKFPLLFVSFFYDLTSDLGTQIKNYLCHHVFFTYNLLYFFEYVIKELLMYKITQEMF